MLRLLVDQLDARIRDLVHAFCDPVRWDGAPVQDFVAESVKLNVHAYRRSGPLFRASLSTAVSDAEFRERRRITMLFGAEAQKKFLLTRRSELTCPDVARASDAMFELMVSTLDHELLYGPITLTAPNTEGALIADLTARSLEILGARDAVDEEAREDGVVVDVTDDGGADEPGGAGSVTSTAAG